MRFFESYACRSGAHCGVCRSPERGRAFRKSVAANNGVPEDFACPHGKPWEGQAAPLTVGGVLHGAVGAFKAVAGIGRAPEDVIAARLRICQGGDGQPACEHWGDTLGGQCGLCGCLTNLKTRNASEACPANPPKWGPVTSA